MSDFSEAIVNKRFAIVYDHLCKNGLVKGKSDIGVRLGTYNHIINSILKGARSLTVEQINKLCDIYGVNANYLLGFSETMFLGLGSSDETIIKTESFDFRRRDNITLVHAKALAGYALSLETFLKEETLKSFSLPGVEGNNLLAFEISGDSMLPNITNGDLVVCEAMERGEPLRDNSVYVIVTDVVVAKRIQQIKRDNYLTALRLISDNEASYKPYIVEVDEIKQILRVKARVTNSGMN